MEWCRALWARRPSHFDSSGATLGGCADRIAPQFPAESDQLVSARRWTGLGVPVGRAGVRLMAVLMMMTAEPAPTGADGGRDECAAAVAAGWRAVLPRYRVALSGVGWLALSGLVWP